MAMSKKQHRLLQYESMPIEKINHVDRLFPNETKTCKGGNNSNSSAVISTALSRSSSLDTLSDKRYHYRRQQNHKYHHDLSLEKPKQKLSIDGRLMSNNNLMATSPFKPIDGSNKRKRFSSFEPTPESLDRIFDVLIAAEKRREEHEFWQQKFDHRTTKSRAPTGSGRTHGTTNSNTIPYLRLKHLQSTLNSSLNNADSRSQSYPNKHISLREKSSRQNGCLAENCLRQPTLISQKQRQQQLLLQRNYSPNTIYSTNYPKQQLPPTSKTFASVTATASQQPVRILSVPNGRISGAPQARQTSDELSSISDIWAARSSFEEELKHSKKPANHIRFQSAVSRIRTNELKSFNNKRASSVEQHKLSRTQNKTLSTTKSKFLDLFKFSR